MSIALIIVTTTFPGIRTLARLAKLYDCPVLELCEPEWLDPPLGRPARSAESA